MGNAGGTFDTNGFNATLNSPFGVYGNFGLTKTGTGRLTLTQPGYLDGNSVAVVTVSAGELRVTNAAGSATATMPIQVNSGGTFDGAGAAAGLVTVASGGAVTGGNGTAAAPVIGTLSFRNGLTLASGARVGIKLADATPAFAGTGGSTDLAALPNPTRNNFLNVTGGTTTIDGGTVFTIDGTGLTFQTNTSYSYQIAQGMGNQSALSITTPAQFTAVGFSTTGFNLSVTGNANGGVFLNMIPMAVPEPVGLLAAGAAAWWLARSIRRRRNGAG
jgi:hypothetical protein